MMMAKPEIFIVDYGKGNLWSVLSAFEFLGMQCKVVSDSKCLDKADAIILPGVGSFRSAMQELRKDLMTRSRKW